jgi:electron transfer flavoprotein alpha subunit
LNGQAIRAEKADTGIIDDLFDTVLALTEEFGE